MMCLSVLQSYFTNDLAGTLQFYLVNVRSNASNIPWCMLLSISGICVCLGIYEKYYHYMILLDFRNTYKITLLR